ncbi:MAG TPA: D-2-hydroxyacid dehydrogenase [Candidatus Limnocylindrales bacterium]|nr:D-2-hydroxyacid dehydrogenase [Candidatus Limnocylindrales bacterium]
MKRTLPAETKLVICALHPFSLWNAPLEVGERIRAVWPAMHVVQLEKFDGLALEIADAHIFVGASLRPKQFAAARKLKWIHSTAAGVGQLMYPELRASGIELTNASGVHSVPMAEHILGTMIALARRFPECVRYQQQSHWAQEDLWNAVPPAPRLRELRGQIALFVGFGRVGREVARVAAPLGVRIWAVTRSGRADMGLAERAFAATELREALRGAGFVILAAPETAETTKMMGASEFACMKPSAFFINVARGSLVDEPALIQILQERRIAGAALDVATEEPLSPESPLWKLDNLFITPHVSAVSEHLWERQSNLLQENLERWFSGRELLNRVDLARGY